MAELKDVRGVGTKGLEKLKKLGINTIEDLVTHYPFRYEVLTRGNLQEIDDGDKIIIDGRVESVPILMRFKVGLNKMNFRLVTPSGVVGVSIFNRAFLKNQLTIGTIITVIGKLDKTKNIITANEIKMGGLSDTDRIEPVYHSTSGLSNKTLSSYINMALLEYGNTIRDYIPEYLREKYNFLNKKTSLNIIHNPSTKEKLKDVTIRLKYEELFNFMFKINYLKNQKKQEESGLKRDIDETKLNKFIEKLPFTLTNDQNKVIKEILKDLKDSTRMNRLLQGDVGSGKTIVSFLALIANYYSGYQGALMAPTEILATQHYNNFVKFLGKEKEIKAVLLTGSTSKKKKTAIY